MRSAGELAKRQSAKGGIFYPHNSSPWLSGYRDCCERQERRMGQLAYCSWQARRLKRSTSRPVARLAWVRNSRRQGPGESAFEWSSIEFLTYCLASPPLLPNAHRLSYVVGCVATLQHWKSRYCYTKQLLYCQLLLLIQWTYHCPFSLAIHPPSTEAKLHLVCYWSWTHQSETDHAACHNLHLAEHKLDLCKASYWHITQHPQLPWLLLTCPRTVLRSRRATSQSSMLPSHPAAPLPHQHTASGQSSRYRPLSQMPSKTRGTRRVSWRCRALEVSRPTHDTNIS